MGITNIATIMVAISLSGLPASCSKHSSKASAVEAAEAAPDPNQLVLTNGLETTVELGAGKSCRIKPVIVDKQNVQLTLTLETKLVNGKIGSFSVAQTTTPNGQALAIKVGGTDVNLTPVVMDKP
jgi:hypothetical protein